MSSKSEIFGGGWDAFNYLETDGRLSELSVTITLDEYRELIEQNTALKIENKITKEENERLEKENKAYTEYIMTLHPGQTKALATTIDKFIEDIMKTAEEEESETDDENSD